MSEHVVDVSWSRGEHEFTYDVYNRDHEWRFDGGITVPGSANPKYLGNPGPVDPEEAFVASLSSCHMLTFLAIAARKRLVVDAYDDHAVGVMAKNEAGRLAITQVTLNPKIVLGRPGAGRGGAGADAPPGPPGVLHRQLGHHRDHRGLRN